MIEKYESTSWPVFQRNMSWKTLELEGKTQKKKPWFFVSRLKQSEIQTDLVFFGKDIFDKHVRTPGVSQLCVELQKNDTAEGHLECLMVSQGHQLITQRNIALINHVNYVQ